MSKSVTNRPNRSTLPTSTSKITVPQKTVQPQTSDSTKKRESSSTKSTFSRTDNLKQQAQNTLSKPKPKELTHTSKTSYFQSKGEYYNGTKGKNGFHTELTAVHKQEQIGSKNKNVKIEGKVATAEAKSTINTHKKSASASLGATLAEVGGTANYGNFGVGAKIGIGAGAGGRISLCEDSNKDGKHEVHLDLSGGILGKLGLSIRFPNIASKYICPKTK